ncbi:MAG: hypothetical protein R3190_14180 [Thermoanaerobaculia bacterium]|nr:hypothetical protein [Thermoanaerobaculia bacterium]
MTAAAGDETLRELARISVALETASGPERASLEERREHLRRRVRLAALAALGVEALENEATHIRKRLAAFEAERVGIPRWQSATGGKLTDPRAAGHEINRKLDEATAAERASLQARLGEIEDVLADRDS